MTRSSLIGATQCMMALLILAGAGCARLPYTTRIVADEARVVVSLQREVEPSAYAHPLHLSAAEISAILRGLSVREQVSLPARWYEEERPPKPVFREDEIAVLAPRLAEAFATAGTTDRVAFEVRAPGMNPRYERDITAGWMAVRETFLHIAIEYYHVQQPVRQSSPYDYNYPTPRSAPGSYVLYFEPGRFWVVDPVADRRAVDFRAFLQAVPAGQPR